MKPNIFTASNQQTGFFSLPFEKDTLTLTEETLNKHSKYRKTKKPPVQIKTRNISFTNELLILGIKINEEKEENVYLKVTLNKLLISCSVDTHESYLSRYSYFALYNLMSVKHHIDFEKYYWPDFFDLETGGSKYLDIINDRCGMDILFKSEYDFFFKPNQKLFIPRIEPKITRPPLIFSDETAVDLFNDEAIGFCLADTFLFSWHSNHFPFLITYKGLLNRDKKKIKSFLSFATTFEEGTAYSPMRKELCKIARYMGFLAQIESHDTNNYQFKVELFNNRNMARFNELLKLWNQAILLLASQRHTYYIHTHGFKNIRMKPNKTKIKPCKFSSEIPKICFTWKENKEYYELIYRFRIGGKLMTPYELNTAFLISDVDNPLTFYLFDSLSDCLITMFFAERKFKIFVLKAHFDKNFKYFLDQLKILYEVKNQLDIYI